MRLKSWASNLCPVVVVCLVVGLMSGVHVQTQSPFLVFGSSSGSSQVVKSTSNALWVSLQGGNVASPLLFPSGTSIAPGIAFSSDSGTGFRYIATFGIGVVSNGVTRFMFDGSNLNFALAGTSSVGWTSSATDATLTPDTKISRAAAAELTYSTLLFAALGTPANGTIAICTDCQPTTPATCPATKSSCVCAGSGTGALAVRLNGVWDCGTFQ